MPASRSVVSVLVRFAVRGFSTSSRPALRAAASGGRPRPPDPGRRARLHRWTSNADTVPEWPSPDGSNAQ
jgi:hypothetical protein